MEAPRAGRYSTEMRFFGAGFSPIAEKRVLLFECATAQATSQE